MCNIKDLRLWATHSCLTPVPCISELPGLFQGALEVQQLDLADLSSVRSFAQRLQSEPKIDLLLLNAGEAGVPLSYTQDNFEMQVGTNHFGHFVLVDSLLAKLKQQVSAFVLCILSWCTTGPQHVLRPLPSCRQIACWTIVWLYLCALLAMPVLACHDTCLSVPVHACQCLSLPIIICLM